MIQLPWLEPGATNFPSTSLALTEPNGLLAVGGDLSVPQLLAAYQRGIFPWFDETQPVLWWSPSPRLVLKPGNLHISKSMRKLLRRAPYRVTTDTAFPQVMAACAEPRPDQHGTWITAQIQAAYTALHHLGYAHSIEVWQEDNLVGGLYGVALGRVFFGESMFSRADNASKYGFIRLVSALKALQYGVIDCQVRTPHLVSLGAQEIDRDRFEHLLMNYIYGDYIYGDRLDRNFAVSKLSDAMPPIGRWPKIFESFTSDRGD